MILFLTRPTNKPLMIILSNYTSTCVAIKTFTNHDKVSDYTNFAFSNHVTLSDDTHKYNVDDQTLLSQTGVTVKLFDYTKFANHDTLSD